MRATERLGPATVRRHPIATVGAAAGGCYLILALVMIGCGLAMTHLLATGPIVHWDNAVNAWFAGHRSSGWNTVSADLTLLADTLGVVVVVAALTAALVARRWGRCALLAVIGLAIELSVFLSTTYVVRRPRPGVPHLGSTPSTFSWPSGHTAATLVLYGGAALLVTMATPRRLPRAVAWAVAAGLTSAIALSRIYRGEHHPTDTMAGALLGIGALLAAVVVLRTWSIAVSDRAPTEPPATTKQLTLTEGMAQ